MQRMIPLRKKGVLSRKDISYKVIGESRFAVGGFNF